MCLALPGKIETINGDNATVDFGGIKRTANVSFLNNVKINDWILVHVGFAIEKVNEKKAQDMYNLLDEQ